MPPTPMDWQRLCDELQPDGSLRDIYVHGADEPLWDRFLLALSRSPFRWRWKHGDRSLAGLPRFSEAAKLRETDPVLMLIDLSPTLTLACPFFTAEEFELDVVPNDLQSADAVGMLIGFLTWLAGVVHRPVVLTHENCREDVMLRIEDTGA